MKRHNRKNDEIVLEMIKAKNIAVGYFSVLVIMTIILVNLIGI